MANEDQIIRDIVSERVRQDMKFGLCNHAHAYWLAILTEEVGEVAKEIVEMPMTFCDSTKCL